MGSDDVTWSFSFTAWKSGQPHSDPTKAEAKDCVKIDTTKLWGLVDCTKEKNYACQVAAEEVTTTVGPTTTSASTPNKPTGLSERETGATDQTDAGSAVSGSQGDSSTTLVTSTTVSSKPTNQGSSSGFVCEEGWTVAESMCFKIIETAATFAAAETECAALGEDVKMAAPKSASIMATLNALNPSGEDVWVGLDDRCEVLARQK